MNIIRLVKVSTLLFAMYFVQLPTGAADVAGLAEALQTHTQDVRK